MEKLRKCPFCGKDAVAQTNKAGGIFIFCGTCECDPGCESSDEDGNAEAIAAWNTRPREAEELERALRDMVEHFATPTAERRNESYAKTNKQVVEQARRVLGEKGEQ